MLFKSIFYNISKLYSLSLLVAISLLFFNSNSINLTPENTVFAFDLNGVIIKTDYYKAITTGLKELPKIPALKLFLNPCAITKMYEIKKKYGVGAKFFDELSKNYPDSDQLKETILKLKNFQNINAEMVNIIKELKDCGYKVYIFSNISPESLEYLKEYHPDIIDLFEGVQSPNEENNFLRKPKREAFKLFKNSFNLNQDGQFVVFVDDDTKNINIAKEEGFIGIKYKSPEQFKNDLNKFIIIS